MAVNGHTTQEEQTIFMDGTQPTKSEDSISTQESKDLERSEAQRERARNLPYVNWELLRRSREISRKLGRKPSRTYRIVHPFSGYS